MAGMTTAPLQTHRPRPSPQIPPPPLFARLLRPPIPTPPIPRVYKRFVSFLSAALLTYRQVLLRTCKVGASSTFLRFLLLFSYIACHLLVLPLSSSSARRSRDPCGLESSQRVAPSVGQGVAHELRETLRGSCGGDEHGDVILQLLVVRVKQESALEVCSAFLEVTMPAPRCRSSDEQPQREFCLVVTRGVEQPEGLGAILDAADIVLLGEPARGTVGERLEASSVRIDRSVVCSDSVVEVSLLERAIALLLRLHIRMLRDRLSQPLKVVLDQLVVRQQLACRI
mmetsp:Transcript_7211/g.16504  ORF Transcript_7211/g.16504 Transcript_7211/m.16504 type:complete len:284 (+) Transcript_7211:205-1056(+)